MKQSILSELNEARSNRRAAILATDLNNDSQRLVRKGQVDPGDPLADEFDKRFRSGKSGVIETDDGSVFLTVSVPSPRLVIVGAVHISQALVPMAQIAGFDVSVIDPRTAFASDKRFDKELLYADWPENVLKDHPLDAYTAVAAVTHDPKIDDFALISALQADCFYVGALGSRKTHGKRVDRLLEAGLSADQINRIEAPIGQNIGAASPSEIAVAILGSVIHALRLPEIASK